jgi:hypothetical protein
LLKKTAFSVLLLLGIYLLVELFSWSAIHLALDGGESVASIRQSRAEVLKSKDPRTATLLSAITKLDASLHPYTGVSGSPTKKRFNGYGFREAEGFLSRDPNDFIIAITGGSVAQSVWWRSKDLWREWLGGLPELQGRRIRVISLALSGFKQPQQLASVSYYLALGGRLDVLINLDGFNEIGSGPILDPYMEGTLHPIYPAAETWIPLAGAVASPQSTSRAGEIKLLREAQLEFASWAETLDFSVTANLIWSMGDRLMAARILRLNHQIVAETKRRYNNNEGAIVAPEEVRPYVADLWARTSLQIEYLGRGNHFSYYHFLQPNQYLAGSKKLTAKEAKGGTNDFGQYRENVTLGYPMLRTAGAGLEHDGVLFTDLSAIFVEEDRQIYIDNCCHMNKRGDLAVAEEIASVIREDFAETPCFAEGSEAGPASSSRRCPAPSTD